MQKTSILECVNNDRIWQVQSVRLFVRILLKTESVQFFHAYYVENSVCTIFPGIFCGRHTHLFMKYAGKI